MTNNFFRLLEAWYLVAEYSVTFNILNGCQFTKPFTHHAQNLICISPYYLPYNLHDVSLENLVLGQLIVL